MTTVTPLLDIARTAMRYLSPAELKLLRNELDAALAATVDTSAWDEWEALAADAEVQTPPAIDPVELVSIDAPLMWTIDTSVWVSASEPTQTYHPESRTLLYALRQRGASLVLPYLLLVELSGAIARLRNVTRAERAVRIVRRLPANTFVVLDEVLAERARQLAATHRLRGADAVYAAVAQVFDTMLVSLDNEHLTRLPPVVSVLTPSDALRQLQK